VTILVRSVNKLYMPEPASNPYTRLVRNFAESVKFFRILDRLGCLGIYRILVGVSNHASFTIVKNPFQNTILIRRS